LSPEHPSSAAAKVAEIVAIFRMVPFPGKRSRPYYFQTRLGRGKAHGSK
jgi:hypothetical protein